MEIHLKLIGYILLVLGFMHIFLPKYFNWKEEVKSLSLFNRQVLYVHMIFIALLEVKLGLLCIFYAAEIIETKLGHIIALGLAIFWGLRLVFQLFVYSSKLWKGKTFETIMHCIFTLLWSYMTYVFLNIYF